MAAFTIIYAFMAYLLHLDGYTKEIYALIFGFWIRTRKPVHVPYSAIRKIVGATDPTISEGIKRLTQKGLISADPKPGMKTKYSIVLTPEIWTAYLRDSGQEESPNVPKEHKDFKDSTKASIRTASRNEEHNINKKTQ